MGIISLGIGGGILAIAIYGLAILTTNDGLVFALQSGSCISYNLMGNMGVLYGLFIIPGVLLLVSGILFFKMQEDMNLILAIGLSTGTLVSNIIFTSTWTSYLDRVNQYLYFGSSCGNFADFANQAVVSPLATLPIVFSILAGVLTGLSIFLLLVDKGVFEGGTKLKKDKQKKKKVVLPVVPDTPKSSVPREIYTPNVSEPVNVEIRGRVQQNITEKVACPNCGFPNDAKERICTMCGGILK